MDFDARKGGGCGCGGCFAGIASLVLTAAIGVFAFGIVVGMPKGGSEEAVAAMASCPAVVAAMGSPLTLEPMSPGCGEQSSGGGSGEATWTVGVSGPKASGNVSYRAVYLANQPWDVQSAVVTLDDGRSIVAVPCAGGAAPPGAVPAPGRGVPVERGDKNKGGKRR